MLVFINPISLNPAGMSSKKEIPTITPAVNPSTELMNFAFSLLKKSPVTLPIVVESPAIKVRSNGLINSDFILCC